MKTQQLLQERIVVSIGQAADILELSVPTVTAALKSLEQQGIVRELTGRQRDRQFVYDKYLALLSEGTEPLSA